MRRATGYIRDLHDARDAPYTERLRHRIQKQFGKRLGSVPAMLDLRPRFPAPFNQQALGKCTAAAARGLVVFTEAEGNPATVIDPSDLFIYYNTLVIQGKIEDTGASIRNAMMSLIRYGYCPAKLWNPGNSGFKKKPTEAAYADARKRRLKDGYAARVPRTEAEVCATLAAGNPIEIGFTVYESFESDAVAKTGNVPMPKKGEEVVGGHAVVLAGYHRKNKRFLVRNSWGTGWGQKGYCWMPFDFVLSPNASDFWTVVKVEEA